MEHNKDIGDFIKERLTTAQRSPQVELWDKVQHSLDRKKRRRRFLFFFITGSTGIAVTIAVLALGLNTTASEQEPSLINDISVESKNSFEIDKSNTVSDMGTEVDSSEVVMEPWIEDKLDSLLAEESIRIEKKKMATTSEDSEELYKRKPASMDSFSSIKTTYYYYNGKNGGEISTTNKRVIDSLAGFSEVDSIQKRTKINEERNLNATKADSLYK